MRACLPSCFATLLILRSSALCANLLSNPGFEIGPAHGACPTQWGVYGWCGQEFWAHRTGSNGVSFWTWNDGAWGGAWQDVAVTADPGQRVVFSIWAKAERNFHSSKNETWLQIEFYTADGQAAGVMRSDIYAELIGHPDEWRRYEVSSVVPSTGVVKITVKFGGGGFVNVGNQQAVMWDDASLIVLPARHLTPFVEGAETVGLCWNADTQRYFQIWAATDMRGPWTWLRDVTLGNGSTNIWTDPGILGEFDRLFYRVVAVPTDAPRDADYDGLDDMTELTDDGLNPADPDTDDDTIPDGTDPRPSVPNEAPRLSTVRMYSAQNFHTGGSVIFAPSVFEPDGDEVYFRWAVDSAPSGSWCRLNAFAWTPMPWQSGEHRVCLEFDDGWGARSEGAADFVIFHAPPRPWD